MNPKWIEGMMNHGYKGCFEMAASLDYLFSYDATTNIVPDWCYRSINEKWLNDENIRFTQIAKTKLEDFLKNMRNYKYILFTKSDELCFLGTSLSTNSLVIVIGKVIFFQILKNCFVIFFELHITIIFTLDKIQSIIFFICRTPFSCV